MSRYNKIRIVNDASDPDLTKVFIDEVELLYVQSVSFEQSAGGHPTVSIEIIPDSVEIVKNIKDLLLNQSKFDTKDVIRIELFNEKHKL